MSKIIYFGKNCDSAEKWLIGALFSKTFDGILPSQVPNPCTNCLGWMPFSTSQ